MSAMVIAQYSFPIKTESVTQGFLRHKVVFDKLDSCPPIAGLCPELELELNIQMVAMISAPDEKLTRSQPWPGSRGCMARWCSAPSRWVRVNCRQGLEVALLTEVSLMYASFFGLNALGPPQMLREAVALLGR